MHANIRTTQHYFTYELLKRGKWSMHYRNFPTSCNGFSKKCEVLYSITAFDLVTLVQTLL